MGDLFSRRSFIKTLLGASSSLFLMGANPKLFYRNLIKISGEGTSDNSSEVPRKKTKQPPKKPNIVLFVIDLERFDRFSFENSVDTTPFISSLSEKGIFFSNASTPSTWTYPSHASMLTGISPFNLQVDLRMKNQSYIEPKYWNSFQVLNEMGYQTMLIGDNGGSILNPTTRYSLSRGLDYYDSWIGGTWDGGWRCYSNLGPDENQEYRGIPFPKKNEKAKGLGIDHINQLTEVKPGEKEAYPDLYPIFKKHSYFNDRNGPLFKFIEEKKRAESPFFILYNLHFYFQKMMTEDSIFKEWFLQYIEQNKKERILRKILGNRNDITFPGINTHEMSHFQWYKFLLRYGLSLSDCVIRRFFEYMKETGHLEDTIIMVTTDHGVTYTEHDGRPDGHGENYPLECLTRTFLTINSGSDRYLESLKGEYKQKISTKDIFLTLVHLASKEVYSEVKSNYDSLSLYERAAKNKFDEIVVSESALGPSSGENLWPIALTYAFFWGKYKMHYSPSLGVEKLFDISKDPLEFNEIKKGHYKVRRKLKKFADNYIKQNGHEKIVLSEKPTREYRRDNPNLKPDKELLDFFKALGYIQ